MKLYKVEKNIECCGECPNKYRASEMDDLHCKLLSKHDIICNDEIHEWCPLPDIKEA